MVVSASPPPPPAPPATTGVFEPMSVSASPPPPPATTGVFEPLPAPLPFVTQMFYMCECLCFLVCVRLLMAAFTGFTLCESRQYGFVCEITCYIWMVICTCEEYWWLPERELIPPQPGYPQAPNHMDGLLWFRSAPAVPVVVSVTPWRNFPGRTPTRLHLG